MKMKLLAVSLAACLLGVLLAFYYVMTIASTHVGLDNRGDLLPMRAVERTVVTHDDAVAHQHAPHEVEEVEEGKLDDDGQLIDEPEYIEEVVDSYGTTRQYYDRGTGFASAGVVETEDGTFTWYSQNDMPGSGLTELNGNGRTVDDRGFVVDGDGYIAVAVPSQEAGNYNVGDVVETPYGPGKVYDHNDGNAWDIYTDY